MSSVNYTSAAAFRDYVESRGEELISRIFFGFQTADLVTIHDGVKGSKILTEAIIGENLIKRWRAQFDPVSNAAEFVPRVLSTTLAKLDLSFVPQDLEATYLGDMRKKGQNPRDYPFEEYLLDKIISKAHRELEVAIWQAIQTATPAALDNLNQLFDGFLHMIADAITATDLTVTPTGAITTTNIVDNVEKVVDSLDLDAEMEETVTFLSVRNFKWYMRRYRNEWGKYTAPTQMREKVDFTNNTLVAVPGMGTSNRILVTAASNLHIGYDDITDFNMFNFEQNKRQLDFWMDLRIGAQIGMLRDGVMAVNELT
jgi:hypothetical protein